MNLFPASLVEFPGNYSLKLVHLSFLKVMIYGVDKYFCTADVEKFGGETSSFSGFMILLAENPVKDRRGILAVSRFPRKKSFTNILE